MSRSVKAKVCLVGKEAVGKTSLIRRYVLDEFDEKYQSTLGAKVTKTDLTVPGEGQEIPVELIIWDIMGTRGSLELPDAYFSGTQGVFAVCDVTRRETLRDLADWIASAFRLAGTVPMLVLGNKADRRDEREVSESDLRAFAESHASPYLFTSARTGENVESAFQTLAQAIVARVR